MIVSLWTHSTSSTVVPRQSYANPTYAVNSPLDRGRMVLNIPAHSSFCNSSNACSPTYINGSLSYCQLSGRNCYWHSPVQYANCLSTCAWGTFVYSTTAAEPTVTNPHPPACNSTLPSNTVIVDDLPEPVYNVAGCGSRNWTSKGTFALTQGKDAVGTPISLIDTHQLGAGFGGHIYFTHNRLASDTSHLVTGTWTPPTLATQSYHVLAHLPSTGATSNSAHYKITTSNGSVIEKVIDQHQQQDQWMGLGYFALGSNAKVVLNNVSDDKTLGVHDVAFDAMAFVPVAGTVVNHSFDAVSIFDFNQDMNTNAPWLVNTPLRTMTTLHDWAVQYSSGGPCWNGSCQGTYKGVLSYPQCSGAANNGCVLSATRTATQAWYNDAVAGGTSTTNHTANMSEAKWMGFSVPVPPNTITSSTFAADDSYKIKTHIDTSFLINNGAIVPGSEEARSTFRTGDTHIPTFVTGLIKGISSDYGIPLPDLSFSTKDLNTYSNDATSSNPLVTGKTPGRAYAQFSQPVQVINNNQCVAMKTISGGSIGWRIVVAQDSVRNQMSGWVAAVAAKRQAGLVPQAVSDVAAEINNMFFASGSIFHHAPPIWQQVNAKVCTNGTISTTGGPGVSYSDIAEQSYMPDLCLYYDGHMINQSGNPTANPVKKGDFLDFSNSSLTSPNGNPYDMCNFEARGSGGNPWNIVFTQNAGTRPLPVSFCDQPGVWHGGEWAQ